MLKGLLLGSLLLASQIAHANPYFDPSQVPQDSSYGKLPKLKVSKPLPLFSQTGSEVLRISVKVDLKTERYSLATLTKENSGTPAMVRRATQISSLGSYRGILRNSSGKIVGVDSIGTGKEFRKLTDAITFRFPSQKGSLSFEVEAENPVSGKMEKVFAQNFDADQVATIASSIPVDIRQIGMPNNSDSLRVNIYAEGYSADKKDLFFLDAAKAVAALVKNNFPHVDQMNFLAVFAASNQALGTATDLGLPVKERDSFLGLYFPYWDNFGRWYHVVYPTREEKFRQGLATAPYDYAIVLLDSDDYFGVGNFREHTAVPAHNSAFVYLLLHEIGHFFGLNEEYDSSGRTELEFAPQIDEPWSQNITFLKSKDHSDLKWKQFVSPMTPIPTAIAAWEDTPAKYGAYKGGYAESSPIGHSHKPGLNCIMDRYQNFCDVCRDAIGKVVEFDRAVSVKKR